MVQKKDLLSNMTKWIRPLTQWLIVVSMPMFLGFSMILLIISPAYLREQYNKPYFPADTFGFSDEERLTLALVAIDYLHSDAPAEEAISLLKEQTMPGANNQPLYNEIEIGHMVDVKNLIDTIQQLFWLTAVVIVSGITWLSAKPETRPRLIGQSRVGGL